MPRARYREKIHRKQREDSIYSKKLSNLRKWKNSIHSTNVFLPPYLLFDKNKNMDFVLG
jgi:hypothetical protein